MAFSRVRPICTPKKRESYCGKFLLCEMYTTENKGGRVWSKKMSCLFAQTAFTPPLLVHGGAYRRRFFCCDLSRVLFLHWFGFDHFYSRYIFWSSHFLVLQFGRKKACFCICGFVGAGRQLITDPGTGKEEQDCVRACSCAPLSLVMTTASFTAFLSPLSSLLLSSS